MFNVNISIDDVSPHPLSSTKVLERCYEMIEEFEDIKFDCIFDTQKAVLRTIALKRIRCSYFISSASSGFFSTNKIKKKSTHISRQYYLEDLFDLLDIFSKGFFWPYSISYTGNLLPFKSFILNLLSIFFILIL